MRRAVLGTVLVALWIALPAVVLAVRLWTVAASPTTFGAGTTTSVRLTVTNIGDSSGGDEITCVRVQLPAGFTVSSVGIVSVYGQTSGSSYSAWQAVWPGASIVTFKNPDDHTPLIGSTPPVNQAVFRITGIAAAAGAMTWTATAYDKPSSAGSTSCGSGNFTPVPLAFVITPWPAPTPTPGPAATPTPAPTTTSAPTPTPTSAPTPTPVPTSTTAPTPGPTPPSPSAPVPTGSPSPTAPVAAGSIRPSAEPSPAESSPASPAPDRSGAPRDPASPPSSEPGAEPGADPRASDGGMRIGGSPGDGGGRTDPVGGLDGAAFAVLVGLPGGALAWGYPALVVSVPGLVLLIVIGAQSIGALAWLPLVRRRLGGFGIRRGDDDRAS